LSFKHFPQSINYTGIASNFAKASDDKQGWIPAHHAIGVMSGMTEYAGVVRFSPIPPYLHTVFSRVSVLATP